MKKLTLLVTMAANLFFTPRNYCAADSEPHTTSLVRSINGFLAIPREERTAPQHFVPFLQLARSLDSPEQKEIATNTLSTVFRSNHHPIMQWLVLNNPTELDKAIADYTAVAAAQPAYRAPDKPVTMRLSDGYDLGQTTPQEIIPPVAIDNDILTAQPVAPISFSLAVLEDDLLPGHGATRLQSLVARSIVRDLLAKNPGALLSQEAFAAQAPGNFDFYNLTHEIAREYYTIKEGDIRQVPDWLKPSAVALQRFATTFLEKIRLDEIPKCAIDSKQELSNYIPAHLIDAVIYDLAREIYVADRRIEQVPTWLQPHIRVSMQDLIDRGLIGNSDFISNIAYLLFLRAMLTLQSSYADQYLKIS